MDESQLHLFPKSDYSLHLAEKPNRRFLRVICQDWHNLQIKGQIVNNLGLSIHIRSPSLILSFILLVKIVKDIISSGQYTNRPQAKSDMWIGHILTSG